MAVALEVGVLDLGAEFGAHTLIFGGALQTAGAIAARHLQPSADAFYDFLVGIFFDLHFFYRPVLIFVLVWVIIKKKPM